MDNENGNLPTTKVLVIVWFALLSSQLVYTFVAGHQFDYDYSSAWQNVNLVENTILMITLAMAIAMMVAGFLLPKLLISNLESKGIEKQSLAQALLVPMIIRWALFEAIVILGLASSFMQEQNFILPFTVLSVLLFLKSFPSATYLQSQLDRPI